MSQPSSAQRRALRTLRRTLLSSLVAGALAAVLSVAANTPAVAQQSTGWADPDAPAQADPQRDPEAPPVTPAATPLRPRPAFTPAAPTLRAPTATPVRPSPTALPPTPSPTALPRPSPTATLALGIPPLPVKPILPIAPPTARPTVAPPPPTTLPNDANLPLPTALPPAAAASAIAAAATGGEPAAGEGEKVIYLTFDDGPSPWTPQVLDVLAEFDAHATFFVIGRQAAVEPETIRKMYEAGHGIANHSWSHTSFRGMGWQSFKWEIEATAEALGAYETKCIRPPYGHTDGNTANFTQDLGYTLALWNVDPQDWQMPGANVIANRVLGVAHSASVVLLHDGGGDRSQTVAALRTILTRMKADGYAFKALCREAPVPEINGTPKPDNAPPQPTTAPELPPMPSPEQIAQTDGEDAGKAVEMEAPPATPVPNTRGAIVLPQAGATVSGIQPVIGYAQSETFEKWQLDLLVNGSEELFLTVSDAQVDGPTPLFGWDTSLYPNGVHMLRLRVVYAGSNYDEYFAHVTVQN